MFEDELIGSCPLLERSPLPLKLSLIRVKMCGIDLLDDPLALQFDLFGIFPSFKEGLEVEAAVLVLDELPLVFHQLDFLHRVFQCLAIRKLWGHDLWRHLGFLQKVREVGIFTFRIALRWERSRVKGIYWRESFQILDIIFEFWWNQAIVWRRVYLLHFNFLIKL